MNIVIAAHYNLNNGDRALLEATIKILNSTLQDASIVVSAYQPRLLIDNRFKTVGWAIRDGRVGNILLKLTRFDCVRKFFRKHYSLVCDKNYIDALKNADLVMISGGHHLTDILSRESYYMLASNFYVPIALKKRIIMLPQSIGPATYNDVRQSIQYILENVDAIAYRDNSSFDFINSLGVNCNASYVPDLLYSLSAKKVDDKRNTVGVALYHSYAEDNKNRILPFTIKNLTLIIDKLLDRGYNIKIIPMDEGDEEYSRKIYKNLTSKNKNEKYLIAQRGNSILELIDEFGGLSFVLAYKTHSTIFSMICNTPLIAIAYHPKSIEFMDKIGLSEYAIRDIDATCDNVMAMIEKLESNTDSIKELEKKGVESNRMLINNYILETLK